ncbi:hypothetical protein Patl1_12521 [Pistacia atlantica]|uniref:Uncharacterized protein n=1 Tax=Pistacia atlantica TaxID=434234 RepID=A0ACC1AYP9_9ROSI|nr:hypothetical protein Patl1_12521 [Pistacia atlantica]
MRPLQCYRSLPLFLILTIAFFFFSSSLFCFTHGASNHLAFQPPLPSESITEVRRFVPEGPSDAPMNEDDDDNNDDYEGSSSIVLAAKRTYRRDPLNGFRRYTGGWNIKEVHYWASVGFTAAPLFAIAAIWFLGFGVCLLLICIRHFCSRREPYGYSKIAYALSLIFLIFFVILAAIGFVILYAGQGKFHGSTTSTLDYVVSQADATLDRLNGVSDYLAAAKQLQVDKIFLPSNIQTDIDNIEAKLNASASNLADKTAKSSHDIRDLLDSVRLALILIGAIMLVLAFLGFLFSMFGMQVLVYIDSLQRNGLWNLCSLVVFGWILVAGTFILCGVFLLLHNAAGDTCVAMNEYAQNPTAHTSLDDIIPCVDKATAQETITRSKEVSSQIVEVINEVITNVSNINFAPAFVPFYFNQSGPLVPILCNPFNSDLTNHPCSASELDFNNATVVWNNYVCQVSPTGVCTTPGRLTPTFYSQMSAAVNVSNGLLNDSPFLVELEDCTFVRETFSNIYRDRCPDLQLYSKWIYVGLVMVSTAVMLSLVFWVIYGRERHHRLYTKRLNKSGLEEKKSLELEEIQENKILEERKDS